MTADLVGWQNAEALEHRRRVRNAMGLSLAIHAGFLGLFALAPPTLVVDAPAAISVDLIAPPLAPPGGGRKAPAPAAKPAAKAPTPAKAAPPPAPEPPPPPIAKAPVQVLPEETPGKVRKAPPEPTESTAAPKKKPPTKPAPRRRPKREDPVSLEDAMAALSDELGGDETDTLLQPRDDPGAAAGDSDSTGAPTTGVQVSPEQLAWDRKVIGQVSRVFRDLVSYRGRGLVVRIKIKVGADGALVEPPDLLGTSGDLDFDRTALSAVIVAAPYPPPPTPAPRVLSLRPESAGL